MRKIIYPTSQPILHKFENNYLNALTIVNQDAINAHLDNIPFKGKKLKFNDLIKLKFDELIAFEPTILAYSEKQNISVVGKKKTYTNAFNELFLYSNNQPKIADFFMKQSQVNIKTCYYCGIDYINSFCDLEDYYNGLDFANRADFAELQLIKGVGKVRAKDLIDRRKINQFKSIVDIGLNQGIRDQFGNFDLKNGHNHFTLDHVIPQKSHKFYSLCLYNLVPSCYSCNSKFKKAIEFTIDARLSRISPTSALYSLTADFNFKIFYPNNIGNIKSNSDFILKRSVRTNRNHIEEYLAMFKISGRYIFHKDIILDLIYKKISNPDTFIKELSRRNGKSEMTIRKEIFGADLFDSDKSEMPLVKFKRDIAKRLKIKGVI